MKRAFLYILLFYLTVHFLLPGTYYLIAGFFNTYGVMQDNKSLLKGFYINFFSITIAIIIIYFIPDKNGRQLAMPRFYSVVPLFYFSIFFSIVYFFIRGGFEGRLTNNMAGSIFSYFSLFLNPNMILLCVFFYQRKKFKVGILFMVYLFYTILTGSRSGLLSLFLIFLIYPAFKNFAIYKRGIKTILIALGIVSPLFFIAATILVRKANIPLTPGMIANAIVGRLSFLETSMLPIHYKDLGDPLEIFYRKYDLLNQLKLIIDTIFPGNLFGGDVAPNQYYRAAFLGYSESYVATAYTSINITLPVYLYMYFGSAVSCIITVIIIVFYYRLCMFFKSNVFLFVPLLATLYSLLVFFDWTLWFLQVFTFALTAIAVYGYSILRRALVDIIKTKAAVNTISA